MTDKEHAERCDMCKWWYRNNEFHSFGKCHRYPPIAQIQGDASAIETEYQFPSTLGIDFCGEFTSGNPVIKNQHKKFRSHIDLLADFFR